MNLYKPHSIQFLSKIKNMNFIEIQFKRGYGIFDPMFILIFTDNNSELTIEVESNFRVRNDKEILLVFNDLYIDKKREEISVRKYRSQKNIEKTFLKMALDEVNNLLKNMFVEEVIIKEYGDLYITFSNGIFLEITNDTHLENAVLFRIIDNKDNHIDSYEIKYTNNNIILNIDSY